MSSMRALFAVALTIGMLAAGCSSSGSDGSDVGTAATPAATADEGADVTEPTSTEPTSAEPTATQNDAADSCDSVAAEVDLWPDLEAVAPDVAEQIRLATRGLTQPNRFSCEPMVMVEPLVAAAEVGAAAVASVEHNDPYVRIDLFAYESADAAATAGSRESLLAALADKLPTNASSDYSSGRPALRFVTTWLDPDATGDKPGEDYFTTTDELRAAFDIALYYEQSIFGDE